MSSKYLIETLGCKVNSYESEAVKSLLEQKGYISVSNGEKANICVVNTCSVTSTSDSKSRQKIRHLIKNNPDAIMVVMGCYSQASSDEVSKIDGVNIVIGTNFRSQIDSLIDEFKATNKQIIKVEDSKEYNEFEELSVIKYSDNTRAYVKIEDGCNNFCTFCIIPYTRGRVKSRQKESIIEEIKLLVKNGYKEIILTGIHTGGYGQDLENYSFKDLLKEIIEKVEGLRRLRISSIEINELNEKIIELIKNRNVIVNHLHIPLQAGSNDILKRMNRKYNVEQFISKIDEIREMIPDLSITTDVIVGFPYESEDNFYETIKTIRRANFSKVHVFPYSSRKGTVASKMASQVDPLVKKSRVERLIDLSNELGKKYASQFLNKEMDVLFESKTNDGFIKGHTTNFLLVKVKSDENLQGEIKKVFLKEIDETSKECEIIGLLN